MVAAGLARRCEVQIAYAIGVAQPVGVHVNTFGTGKVDEQVLEKYIQTSFDMRPKAIIEQLDLLKPIYKKTAAYGHFGRERIFVGEDDPRREDGRRPRPTPLRGARRQRHCPLPPRSARAKKDEQAEA